MRKIAELKNDLAGVAVKVYYNPEAEEYVARLFMAGKLYEPADAFDTDKESILGTARAMLAHSTVKRNPATKRARKPAARKKPLASGLREIHIDIGSHNENPPRKSRLQTFTSAKRPKYLLQVRGASGWETIREAQSLAQARKQAKPFGNMGSRLRIYKP